MNKNACISVVQIHIYNVSFEISHCFFIVLTLLSLHTCFEYHIIILSIELTVTSYKPFTRATMHLLLSIEHYQGGL